MFTRTRSALRLVTLGLGLTLVAASASAGAAAAPDFTGLWRFDAAHSDLPQRSEGPPARDGHESRGGRGGRPGGMMGGPGGMMGGPGDGIEAGGRHAREGAGGPGEGRGPRGAGEAGARPAMLPPLVHITQTSTIVSIEDSAGVVLEEITTIGSATDTLAHAPNAMVSRGAWADTALVVDRGGSNGFKLTRTLTLEQAGQVLVIRTHFEAPDGARARDFRRVYRRSTEE